MTMALTLATLLWALRFQRLGEAKALFWLVFFFTQGVAHQRAVGFLLLPPPCPTAIIRKSKGDDISAACGQLKAKLLIGKK